MNSTPPFEFIWKNHRPFRFGDSRVYLKNDHTDLTHRALAAPAVASGPAPKRAGSVGPVLVGPCGVVPPVGPVGIDVVFLSASKRSFRPIT